MKTQGAWRSLLVLGLTALLLWAFLRGLDWSALGSALVSAHPSDLALGAAVTAGMYLIRAWRWQYLLSPLDRVRVSRLYSITVVGFMTGLVIPRAQEGLRPYLVSRSSSIPVSAAFASIILERLLDLMAVLALFGLYVYVLPFPPPGREAMAVAKAGGAFAAGISLSVLAALFAFHRNAERATKLLDRVFALLPSRAAAWLGGFVRSFADGLDVLRAPATHLLAIVGQSFLLWLAIDLAVYLNNRAYDLALPFPSTFFITAVLVVGVAVPTPGMVGGYHAAYRYALTQAYGVDAARAVAAGFTGHALSTLPVLLLGLFFLRSEGLSLRKVAAMAEDKGKDDGSRPAAGRPPEDEAGAEAREKPEPRRRDPGPGDPDGLPRVANKAEEVL